MKTRLFNYKLYIDGLKQLRAMGFVLCAATLLVCIFPVISNYRPDTVHLGSYDTYTPIPSAAGTMPEILIFMYLGSLLIVYRLFYFLNHRKTSDCYHSLPQSRICTYLSLAASAFTWIYGIIICSVLATQLVYGFTGTPVYAVYFPYILFANLAGATLVAGAALLAMSITGTVFSNIIVTGLILILPRFILTSMGIAISELTPATNLDELGIFFNPYINIPTGLIYSLLDPYTSARIAVSGILLNTGSIIYTSVFGILYTTAGGILFKIRKSETAMKNAAGKPLQHIYRCALTLPFLILIIIINIPYAKSLNNYIFNDFKLFILFFILSLAIYFGYELLTTKKMKNLLIAAPYYLAVVAIAFALGFSIQLISNDVLNKVPKPEEIASIKISNPNLNYFETSYANLCTKDIIYNDPKLKVIVSDAIRERWARNSINGITQTSYDGDNAFSVTYTNGATINRRALLSPKQAQSLKDIQNNSPAYTQSIHALPPDNDIQHISIGDLPREQVKEVWRTFKEETKGLTNEQMEQINIAFGVNNDLKNIFVTGVSGLKQFISYYNLSALTPKTSNLFLQYSYKNFYYKYKYKIDYIINRFQLTDDDNYELKIELCNIPGENNSQNNIRFKDSQYSDDKNKLMHDNNRKLLEILAQDGLQQPEITKPFAKINLRVDSIADYDGDFYIALSDEQIKKLRELYTQTYAYIPNNRENNHEYDY